MKKAFAVGMLALAAGACGGPDLEKYCEETLDCSGLGMFSGVDLVDACEDGLEKQLDDVCKDSEVDKIDQAIEDCKKKNACDFVTCVAAKEPEASMCLVPEYDFESVCGDGIVDIDEDCEGTDLDGEECGTQTGGTLPGGTLTCKDDCTFDTSACTEL